MSTKNKKRKSHKVVREAKPKSLKTEPVHDVDDSCHLAANDPTSISSLSVSKSKSSDGKFTSKKEDKCTKQQKDDINPGSTLEDDIKWCIAQLEMAVVSKTVPKKQKEESIKYMKLLQSSKTPVPRKRQIMRQNFGDYKQKMKERPLLDDDITLKIADSEVMGSAGIFHRKSVNFQPNSCGNDKQGAVGGGVDSHSLRDLCRELEGTSFTFDFSID